MTINDKRVIEAAPLDFLCQRCYDIIKWKIDYHKYKVLSKPRKCEKCEKTHVFKAYRIICDPCAFKDKKTGILYCTKCV